MKRLPTEYEERYKDYLERYKKFKEEKESIKELIEEVESKKAKSLYGNLSCGK